MSSLDQNRADVLRRLLWCPRCHGDLSWQEGRCVCSACGGAFAFHDRIPRFHEGATEGGEDAAFQAQQMWNSGVAAKLYNFGKRYVNSELFVRDHIREALGATAPGAVVVELGSGNRRLREDVINVELFPFPNVDLLADIAATPFRDASVDLALLDSVVEHVPDPRRVVAEVHRILRPGGRAVCVVPFVFPYHGYPRHYCNFTKDGLEVLFAGFSTCEVDANTGPSAALTNLLSEYFAVAVSGGNTTIYTAAKGLALLPLFALKHLDRLWGSKGRSARLAALLGAVAIK